MQATELAEFTAKISLLEEAKKKKDEEATEWQHKVGGAAEVLPGVPKPRSLLSVGEPRVACKFVHLRSGVSQFRISKAHLFYSVNYKIKIIIISLHYRKNMKLWLLVELFMTAILNFI